METNGLHLTLGGVAAVISLVGSLGGVWRFLLKPILDGMKAEQKATDEWRRSMDVRVTPLNVKCRPLVSITLPCCRNNWLPSPIGWLCSEE